MVYRKKNGSFCLQTKTSPPYDASVGFGQNVVIHNNKTSQAYKHRVDYDQKTLEWCLHQLNESDSGDYKFSVTKDDRFHSETYVLTVEGKGFFLSVCSHTILQCESV